MSVGSEEGKVIVWMAKHRKEMEHWAEFCVFRDAYDKILITYGCMLLREDFEVSVGRATIGEASVRM